MGGEWNSQGGSNIGRLVEQPGRAKQWEVSGTAREGQTVGGWWNSQGGSNSGRLVEQPGRVKQWEVSGTAR